MTDKDHSPARDDVAELLAREQRRCRAIGEADWATVEQMLTDDFTYVHSSGRIEHTADYMVGLKGRKRAVERGELLVLVHGDAAAIIGDHLYYSEMEPGEPLTLVDMIATQMWTREDGTWRLVAHQNTRHPDR